MDLLLSCFFHLNGYVQGDTAFDYVINVKVLDSVHTTPEEFENVVLFLRLDLTSTLIRHENGALQTGRI